MTTSTTLGCIFMTPLICFLATASSDAPATLSEFKMGSYLSNAAPLEEREMSHATWWSVFIIVVNGHQQATEHGNNEQMCLAANAVLGQTFHQAGCF